MYYYKLCICYDSSQHPLQWVGQEVETMGYSGYFSRHSSLSGTSSWVFSSHRHHLKVKAKVRIKVRVMKVKVHSQPAEKHQYAEDPNREHYCLVLFYLYLMDHAWHKPCTSASYSPTPNCSCNPKIFNSYSASRDNWCTATLWNRIMTAQCEGMGK